MTNNKPEVVVMKPRDMALRMLLVDRRGLTALEYGLIGSVLFAVIFAGFAMLANDLSSEFSNIGNSL
jgi:Flp pilus assembly pilin Flp